MITKTVYDLAYSYYRKCKALDAIEDANNYDYDPDTDEYCQWLAHQKAKLWVLIKDDKWRKIRLAAYASYEKRLEVSRWEMAYLPLVTKVQSHYRMQLNHRRLYRVMRVWWRVGWVMTFHHQRSVIVTEFNARAHDDIPF